MQFYALNLSVSGKPVAAVPAEVTLNLSSAHSIFAVSLTAAFWAGYFWVLRLAFENFAAVRAIYDFVFRVFSPLPKKKGNLRVKPRARGGLKSIPRLKHLGI
jgi:hypothetical protein